MSAYLRIFLLVALAIGLAATRQRIAAQGDFEWRVPLTQNVVAPGTIEAENICFKTHSFRVEPETLPFMRLLAPGSFSVTPGGSHKVPVEFDTRNMKPGRR